VKKLAGLLERRLVAALGYSLQGLRACFRHEEAFRVEVMLSLVLVPAALLLAESLLEGALMLGAVLLVMIVELLNSAVEAVVDRFGAERHELAGRAKDMGSAAVLLSMLLLLLIWGACLLEQPV